MQVLPELVLAVGMVVIGIPSDGILNRRRPQAGATLAMVRFVNNTAMGATLTANGVRLFERVPTGMVTDYVEVRDSAIAFALVLRDQPGEPATATEKVEDGARYTITARTGMEGTQELVVSRESRTVGAGLEW